MRYYQCNYEDMFAGSEKESNVQSLSASTEHFYFEIFLIHKTSLQKELESLKIRFWDGYCHERCSEIVYNVAKCRFSGDRRAKRRAYDFILSDCFKVPHQILNLVLGILEK
jgi:DNA polymerase/3'-5' exonuclease PolX